MRRIARALGVLAVAVAALACHAGELQDRMRIAQEVHLALTDGSPDALARLEERYASALAQQTRLASGVFLANRMVRVLLADAPPHLPSPAAGKLDPGLEQYWAQMEARTQAWIDRSPQSALPVLALAHAYLGHAFSFRGGGYAREVRPEDWAPFRHYVDLAAATLARHEAVGRKDPNWWYETIRMGKLQSWDAERFEAVALAAIDAFPYQYDLHFAISEALVPQWGGSVEALAAYADEAVKRTRAKEGEALYARIFWNVHGHLGKDFLAQPGSPWPRIRAGFDDVIRQYPDAWNINYFARMACEARDHDTAHRLLLRIGGDVVEEAWSSRTAYRRCMNESGAKQKAPL